MSPFSSLLSTDKKVARFREWFEILEYVVVSLAPIGYAPPAEDDVLLIPLLWMFEAGIQFPLHRLFQEFLAFLGLTLGQCSNNLVRIVMGMVSLNEITSSHLGVPDILHHYVLFRSPRGLWGLRQRPSRTTLLTNLPDTDQGTYDDMISVIGRWEFAAGEDQSFRVPRSEEQHV